ncbi:uncharacterized protein LOC110007613 [Amborella trichopoda]|uniref:uncharacterized protein LOC110007613 n=1 Tax=Amborella trichopoda TaxID=13333 RepID=UPI0009C1A7F9|nr:uncharacterized protein LOC110007613 [Amborella trichopoda]|eukprot:XP_020525382.1 uncharacterized protein LOC110007613 [Amborella trichopoda]
MIVLIYVDAIVITGNDNEGISKLKNYLHKKFDIKDLRQLRYFLRIEVGYSKKGIFLSQRKYVLDLLKEIGKIGVKPLELSIDYNYNISSTDGELLQDIGRYKRLVGRLIYLTITRPDIAHVVGLVSQFMRDPRTRHLEAVDKILRYLKSSPGRVIWMKNNNNIDICGYFDADWVGNPNDRRSTTGYCAMVGGNLVSLKRNKQYVVARSSAEAEHRAMASIASVYG